ncbi:PIN domain-like protein [Rhypophila sp. PSN 637]
MGIKGLWEEVKDVDPGRTVELPILAAEFFAERNDNFFKAVTSEADAKKWGGMNHIVRNFYYHVGHLLAAGVELILVFDGPGKPHEKGSAHPAALRPCAHATGEKDVGGASGRTEQDKECERELSHIIPLCRKLLECMGLPYRDAPAEAEAECAAMERLEIVDAVLTRVGDAFVFGSRRVLQKLTAVKKVAMVREFRIEKLETPQDRNASLRCNDFFLLAMMAGGDYDNGVQGCGSKTAIQLSRHFYLGSQLKAVLAQNDPAVVKRWKSRLVDTLRENPGPKLSHRFPCIAKTIENNPSFPSRTIANYYLNPKVSTDLNVPHIDWTKNLQIQDLRKFTRTFLDWRYQLFAGKFVRLLALPALSRALLLHGNARTDGSALIKTIKTIKRSKEEDGFKALHVEFIPANVVPFDILGEPRPVTEWVPSWSVEYGAPEAFHTWQHEEREETKTKGKKRKMPADDSRPRGRPRKENSLPQQKQDTFIDLTGDSE